jgi:tRNA (cmo5U34)-methyltransferase
VREVRRRLKPRAPFVVAHISIPSGEGERRLWLSRYVAFAIASGVDGERVEKARAAIEFQLPILSPQEDETILREAGFSHVALFYAGFTLRGWSAIA